jgi:hypothetical protein
MKFPKSIIEMKLRVASVRKVVLGRLILGLAGREERRKDFSPAHRLPGQRQAQTSNLQLKRRGWSREKPRRRVGRTAGSGTLGR